MLTASSECPLCRTTRRHQVLAAVPGMTVVRCPACRMMYTLEREGDFRTDRLRPFIDEVYRLQMQNSSLRRALFDKRVLWLEKLCGGKPKTLEVGLGSGEFARAAVRRGWDYTALEPFPHDRFDDVRSEFHVIQQTAEEFTPAETYDLIILDNVLEHLANPIPVLEKLRSALAPQGRLWVQVPNEKGFRWRHRILKHVKESYPTFPAHVNLFTTATLPAMLRRAGFTGVTLSPVRAIDRELLSWLMGRETVPGVVLAAAAVLRKVPVDLWLGQYYWIDAVARPSAATRTAPAAAEPVNAGSAG